MEVPQEILVGLYRIACDVNRPVSGEVYPEALQGMEKSLEWILNFGKENKIDSRGYDLHKNLNKK